VIVDAHHHLWDPAARRHPWLDGLPQLRRPFTLADYRAAAAAEGVTASVLVQVLNSAEETGGFLPYVDRLLDSFGPDRLMFGSDWPVCTLAASYHEVMALARDILGGRLSPGERDAVFGANAAGVYGLSVSP
jgi:L-fuconolactonase